MRRGSRLCSLALPKLAIELPSVGMRFLATAGTPPASIALIDYTYG
jgi:hypothetical protein